VVQAGSPQPPGHPTGGDRLEVTRFRLRFLGPALPPWGSWTGGR
jgi:hypothetical protein